MWDKELQPGTAASTEKFTCCGGSRLACITLSYAAGTAAATEE